MDWFCPKCKIGILIEGCQKTICLFHPKQSRNFFGKSSQNLFQLSQNNRIKILKQSKCAVNKIFTLNDCCCHKYSPVLSKILETLSRNLCKSKDIRAEFKTLLRKVELSQYQLPNFQDSILPSIVGPICSFVSHNSTYQTCRFDMHNAYLHSILEQPLPKGQPIALVGISADRFFQEQILPKKIFSILSVTILPPKNEMSTCLPFLALKDSTGAHPTLCRACTVQKIVSQKCFHSDIERQFDVTCLLMDLSYALQIGYKIVTVNTLYYWPHSQNVQEFDNVLIRFIQSHL